MNKNIINNHYTDASSLYNVSSIDIICPLIREKLLDNLQGDTRGHFKLCLEM